MRGWAMKGLFTLGIYIAIGITGAAFGQAADEPLPGQPLYKAPPTYSPIPPVMAKAFAPIPSPPGWEITGPATPMIKPPPPPPKVVVVKFGNGGRIDEHRATFEGYSRNKARVELRGPCYSACTLMLGYVERENLCIAPGAFMALHAVRGEHFHQFMVAETRKMYETYPPEIRRWIDHSGGWHNLPIDGFWTMYDHSLWALGYPKCAP